MNDSYFLDVIAGANQSLSATMLRGLLWYCTPLYAAGAEFKNWQYRSGFRKPFQVEVPIISIGNITTGGTGKTPTVAWLVKKLQQQEFHPGIVSRGYQSLDGEANDEKRLLDQMLPSVPHQQNRQRVIAAEEVIRQDCDVIVLDDGFQHRKLHRDVDVVLIDALNPFGHDHLLPRGLLREPLHNLSRASAIIITRCDLLGSDALNTLKSRIQRYTKAPIFESQFQPTQLVNANNEIKPIGYAAEQRSSACCGIGNPSAFRRTLAAIGAPVSDERFHVFPDHHHYTEVELDRLAKQAINQHSEILLVTRKDLVKINRPKIRELPVWALDIELVLEKPQELLTLIANHIQARRTSE